MPGGPATLLASPNTTDLRWESWEYGACKHILYRTVGGYSEPESGFKVWLPLHSPQPCFKISPRHCLLQVFDICCFVPSLLFLLFLLYSLPRTRQKLAGSPLLFLAVHALLGVTAAASLLRCILMFLAPRYSPQRESCIMVCTVNCAALTRTGRRRDWRWWAGPACRPPSPRSSSPP